MRALTSATIVLLAALQSGQDAGIAAEFARVRSQIGASVPESQRGSLVQRLDRADAALKAGRTYQALYLFEAAYDGAAAFAFAASSGVRSQEEFVAQWTRLGAPKTRSPQGWRGPAAVAAVAQAAEDRAPATYQSSRPYAEDAGVDAGLYYLGESYAVMDYGAFARSQRWSDAGRRPSFRSIAPEIAAFDREMTSRYETMQRAEHPTYIRASAALKQARSLDQGGSHEGALFQYLLARFLFAPLRGAAGDGATRERIDAARAALPSGVDHSIAELFLQFADEALASDNPDLRRGSPAIVDDVLPAYFDAIASPRDARPTATAAAVTITLVRWPFT